MQEIINEKVISDTIIRWFIYIKLNLKKQRRKGKSVKLC